MGLAGQLKNLFYHEEEEYEYDEEPREVAAGHSPVKREIVLSKPLHLEEARQIVTDLVEGRAVVLNLESTPKSEICRIIDFVSGATYAIAGQFTRASTGCYIATPHNVDLEEDEFNQYYADFYQAKF